MAGRASEIVIRCYRLTTSSGMERMSLSESSDRESLAIGLCMSVVLLLASLATGYREIRFSVDCLGVNLK